MAEFIFYTHEGHTVSPNNEVLESIQILGFEDGESEEVALKKLIANNPWIKESGFDLNEIKSRKAFTNAEIESLNEIIDYLWIDEEKHFEESEKPENHIFLKLKQLKSLVINKSIN